MERFAGIPVTFLLGEEARFKEDIHEDSSFAQQIQDTLARWRVQRDYTGTSWAGVLLFHFALATAVREAAVEAAGWYKYPSSSRQDMDGKDWRLVVPDLGRAGSTVAVNCHSILHDDVWTLATTVYQTQNIDLNKIDLIGDGDHWNRTLQWSLRVAEVLETSGYDYSKPKAHFLRMMRLTHEAKVLSEEIKPLVFEACEQVVPHFLPPSKFSIGVSPELVPREKVGWHIPSGDLGTDYSVIALHPQAFSRDDQYKRSVVMHELIHLVLKTVCRGPESHDENFHRIADLLGMPKEYQN